MVCGTDADRLGGLDQVLDVGVPSAFITSGTKGLGSTAPSTVCVPGVSPDGVLGLHPVGLCVMPNEIAPPATPT